MYMKSDGNGGVNISKTAIALIVCLLILATTFASVVAFSIGVRGDVDVNSENIEDQAEDLEGLHNQVGTNQLDIKEVTTEIKDMRQDLQEIKTDIKTLLIQGGRGQ